MSESLQFTIVFEHGEDGWIVASVPEVPGAHSQGRTRDEARVNVMDALRGILELRFGDAPPLDEGADSRHREVDFRLVRKICADLKIPPPLGPR